MLFINQFTNRSSSYKCRKLKNEKFHLTFFWFWFFCQYVPRCWFVSSNLLPPNATHSNVIYLQHMLPQMRAGCSSPKWMHCIVDDQVELVISRIRPVVGVEVTRPIVLSDYAVIMVKCDTRWRPLHRVHSPTARVHVVVLETQRVATVALWEMQWRGSVVPGGLHLKQINLPILRPARVVLCERPNRWERTVHTVAANTGVDSTVSEAELVLRGETGGIPIRTVLDESDVEHTIEGVCILIVVRLFFSVYPSWIPDHIAPLFQIQWSVEMVLEYNRPAVGGATTDGGDERE